MVRTGIAISSSDRTAVIMIGASWLLPIVTLVLPPLAGWNCTHCMGLEYCKMYCSMVLFPFTKGYTIMLAIFIYFSIILLFVTYLWIFTAVHNKVQRVKSNKGIRKHEMVMIRITISILLLFTVCILPVAIILTLDYVGTGYNAQLIVGLQVFTVLSFINCACNPVLYAWRVPTMRDAIWRSIGRFDKVTEVSRTRKSGIITTRTEKYKIKAGSHSAGNASATESNLSQV
uniref:G-protein coupled receptors family 1 profile domain-containing protein n=1 Tax=Ciona savignyi TaxID=51511 RepID=H2YKA8_CIOSA